MEDKSLYTDKELFHLISQSDHAAFKMLLERHKSNLFGQSLAYLKDVHRAQDIIQEVFLTIWKGRHQLTAIENPENYIFIIARNKIISEFRKKILIPFPEGSEQLWPGPDLLADRQLQDKQLAETIRAAVLRMPPQRRKVFELSRNEGLKYEEIAQRLDISRETVKVHMVKALAFIRAFVGDRAIIFLFFLLFR